MAKKRKNLASDAEATVIHGETIDEWIACTVSVEVER